METIFTTSRSTRPDPAALLSAVRTACGDASATIKPADFPVLFDRWVVTTVGALSGAQTTAVQSAIDSAAEYTPQRFAQDRIDAWPIEMKAFALALIDQLNVIRAALPTPLAPITPAQALAAIRAKAGTL